MAYKIEKNIPQFAPSRKREDTYPFKDMEVGDSFLVTEKDKNVTQRVRSAVAYNNRGRKRFISRTVDGGIRVWRTE